MFKCVCSSHRLLFLSHWKNGVFFCMKSVLSCIVCDCTNIVCVLVFLLLHCVYTVPHFRNIFVHCGDGLPINSLKCSDFSIPFVRVSFLDGIQNCVFCVLLLFYHKRTPSHSKICLWDTEIEREGEQERERVSEWYFWLHATYFISYLHISIFLLFESTSSSSLSFCGIATPKIKSL